MTAPPPPGDSLGDWDAIFDFNRYIGGGSDVVSSSTPSAPRSIFENIPSAAEVAAREFEPKPDYDADPALWGKEVLKEHYWSKQVEILTSLIENRYTAVRSCHDAGKSFIAARAAARWISLHDPGEAFVVSTAPTSAQVSAILWREIQRAHGRGSLAGTITTAGYPQWKLGGELVGYGRKPADYSDSAFQGIHARYVLVIIDEACGVAKNLFDAADALATNKNARVLAIGNPDDPTSHFASVCKPDSGWNVIGIDGLRTPNFTQDAVEWLDCPDCRRIGRTETLTAQLFREESIPYTTEHVPEGLRDMLLSPLWVEERLHRWVGLPNEAQTLAETSSQSALFTAKVRGQFPTGDSEGIVPLGWVEAAMARYRDWKDAGSPLLPANERWVLGVDVARFGEDQTSVAIRQGHILREVRKYRKADTMETTGRVVAAMNPLANSLAIVDVIGVGAGVVDRLREQSRPTIAFNASGSAKGKKDKTGEFEFVNLRAAAWWRMRELLDPAAGSKVMLPDSEMLKADLTTPRWKVMSGGKIQVESKEDIRHRLGRSTDEGDAVVMSFWQGRTTLDHTESDALSWWGASDGSAQQWLPPGGATNDAEALEAWRRTEFSM